MYISRVEVDTDDRRKIRDLTHLGAFHSWVEDSFPDEIEQGIRSRKLWRLDKLYDKTYLLVVSLEKPDLERLEKYGVTGSAETKNYDNYLNSISADDTYRFRVTLNPVYSISRGQGVRGRVVPERTADQQLAFLERKSEQYGFSLIPNEYGITERKYEWQRKKGERSVKLSIVTYEGMLKITDPDTFKDALINGIGKKKAYGCGLMTVIPVK